MTSSKWKLIIFGLGVLTGVGAMGVIAKHPSVLRSAATTVGSYGISAKRRLESLAERTKESITDLIAESDYKSQQRQDGEPRLVKPEKDDEHDHHKHHNH